MPGRSRPAGSGVMRGDAGLYVSVRGSYTPVRADGREGCRMAEGPGSAGEAQLEQLRQEYGAGWELDRDGPDVIAVPAGGGEPLRAPSCPVMRMHLADKAFGDVMGRARAGGGSGG